MLSTILSRFLRKKSSGFTLVELLLVMALIGVLATALVILINPAAQFEKSRDLERKNELAQVARALEQYYNDFGSYPISSADPNYYILDDSHAWGSSWTPYMDVLPMDPTGSQRYIYSSTGQTYTIYAHLERGGQDSQACNVGGTDCANVPGASLCGVGFALSCNYGISSPNVSP